MLAPNFHSSRSFQNTWGDFFPKYLSILRCLPKCFSFWLQYEEKLERFSVRLRCLNFPKFSTDKICSVSYFFHHYLYSNSRYYTRWTSIYDQVKYFEFENYLRLCENWKSQLSWFLVRHLIYHPKIYRVLLKSKYCM